MQNVIFPVIGFLILAIIAVLILFVRFYRIYVSACSIAMNTHSDFWLDQQVTRTVHLVNAGGLQDYFKAPKSLQEKLALSDKILQDVLTNAGMHPKDYNLPAIIKAKFRELGYVDSQ